MTDAEKILHINCKLIKIKLFAANIIVSVGFT